MAIVLFDSNVLIDHTLGIIEATNELAGYDDAAISAISWMESTIKPTPAEIAKFDLDLADAGIVILQTTPDIMRLAAQLRRQTKTKLPDCIIWATAQIHRRILVTCNPDDFGGPGNPQVRVPYKNNNGIIRDVAPLHP